jgi:hypothetical protein
MHTAMNIAGATKFDLSLPPRRDSRLGFVPVMRERGSETSQGEAMRIDMTTAAAFATREYGIDGTARSVTAGTGCAYAGKQGVQVDTFDAGHARR